MNFNYKTLKPTTQIEATASMSRAGYILGRICENTDAETTEMCIQPEYCGFLFCAEGELLLSFTNQTMRLQPYTVFYLLPGMHISIANKLPFSAVYLLLSMNEIREIVSVRHMSQLLLQAIQHPSVQLTELQYERCLSTMQNTLLLDDGDSITPYRIHAIRSGIAQFLYLVCDTLHTDSSSSMMYPKTSYLNRYFVQFIHLLSQSYKRQRQVAFYAEQLYLTPKYLTTLVRQISGLKVSTWIKNFVIAEAIFLLGNSERSVQQIAYDLNFPNQSFFGSYFKRHLGCSPSEYRQRIATITNLANN